MKASRTGTVKAGRVVGLCCRNLPGKPRPLRMMVCVLVKLGLLELNRTDETQARGFDQVAVC